MIDLHCHLLPGVDDGPPDFEGTLALARAAVEAGTRTVVATPHVDHQWNVQPESIAPAAAQVRARLAEAGIELEVLCGAEVALARLIELGPEQTRMIRLGDGPYLLLESPHGVVAGDFQNFVWRILQRGESIVLAHPERCPTFQRHPEQVAQLVQDGVLCSITAGSLAGRFGERVRAFALHLLEQGLVHNVSSDSHGAERRGPALMQGLRHADVHLPGILDQADWLTRQTPEAILSGGPIPPRPQRQRRGALARLFGQ